MWTLLEIYLEEKVLYNDDKLKVVDTYHSRERKRRLNNQGRPITDKEIMRDIKRAIPQLKEEHRNGNIPENKKVWLYNPKSRLNVVIEYKVVPETERNKIKILTVMRHNNFHPSKDTTKKIII